MAQVIQDTTAGGRIGASFGSALSQGLQQLAQHKMNQINQRNQALGFKMIDQPQTFAQGLSMLSPQQQDIVLKSYLENYGLGQLGLQQQPQQSTTQMMQNLQQQKQPMAQQVIPQQQVPMLGKQVASMATIDQQQPAGFKPRVGGPLDLKRQAQVDRANAPFIKESDKAYQNAITALDNIQIMREALATGKVHSGARGKFTPEWLQNTETQMFDKASNTLAGLLASGQGVATGFKIKFAQTQKPNVGQRRETQEKLLDKIEAETRKALLRVEIRDQLIEANGGQQPPNLSSLVNQYMKQYESNPQHLSQIVQPATQQQSQPQEESILGTLGRGALRTASRAGEAVGGALGDVASAGLGLGNYLTGGKIPTYGEVQQKLPISPPTSEQLKELTSKISGGLTDPQGGMEEFFDDLTSTVSSIFTPGKLFGPLASGIKKIGAPEKIAKGIAQVTLPFSGTMPLSKAIKMGIAGEVGAKGAEAFDASPVGQAATKLIFMTAAGRNPLQQIQKAEYDAAKEAFKNTEANFGKAAAKIKNFEKAIDNRAIPTNEKVVIKNLLREVKPTIDEATKRGKSLPVNDIIQLKQDINKWFGLTKYQKVPGELHLPEGARKHIHELLDIVKEPIAEASIINPTGGKAFAIAEDITQGLNKLKESKEFILDNLKYTKAGIHPLKALFTGGPGYAKAIKEFLLKHPEARNAYIKAMAAAAKGSRQAFAKELAKLEKITKSN